MRFVRNVITHPCPNVKVGQAKLTEVRPWMNNYIPYMYVDGITNPSLQLNVGLVDLCLQKEVPEDSGNR